MKFIFFTVLLVALSACQKPSADDANEKICCGSSPSQMIFKTHSGREVVSWNEVSGVDVTIKADAVNHTEQLQRTFDSAKGQKIVRQLNLAYPKQVGSPLGMITGAITVHYKHPGRGESTRQFQIQDEGLLQDSVFFDVTYEPIMTLDRAWLEAQ